MSLSQIFDQPGMTIGNSPFPIDWVRTLPINSSPAGEISPRAATNVIETQGRPRTQGHMSKLYVPSTSSAVHDAPLLGSASIFDVSRAVRQIEVLSDVPIIFVSSPTTLYAIQASGSAKSSYQSGISYTLLEARSVPVSKPPMGGPSELVSKISAARAAASVDPESVEIADAATIDAIKLVERNRLPGSPRVIFSNDGILALQWQRDEYGAALMFAGDAIASIAFRKPGQFYAENGIDIGIEDDLPLRFTEALAKIVA
jgi:hypothetical protein